MKKIIAVSMVSMAALGLSACSNHGGPSGSGRLNQREVQMISTAPQDYDTAGKTYALPGEPRYRGNENAFYKNALRAPANQTYYFSYDSSKMRDQDLRALKVQANYLASHPNAKIRLEGNTDDRGTREYNVGLGWRRDQSVARLLEQLGARPDQIQMVSYGKEHPVVQGNDPKSWALNRRVNLIYKANT